MMLHLEVTPNIGSADLRTVVICCGVECWQSKQALGAVSDGSIGLQKLNRHEVSHWLSHAEKVSQFNPLIKNFDASHIDAYASMYAVAQLLCEMVSHLQ
jgi:hypothetical protein